MPSGGGGTNTVQNSDPWAGQQPYLLQGFQRTEDAYKNPVGYYPGQTTAGPSGYSQLAAQGMGQFGQQGTTAGNAGNAAATQVATGGNPYTGGVAQGLNTLANGQYLNPTGNAVLNNVASNGGGNDVAGALGGLGYIQNNGGANMYAGGLSGLQRTAQGGMLGRNPEFQQMATQAMEATRPNIDAQFASMGRYGSPNHAGAIGDSYADAVGRLAYQDYGAERQLQQQAQGQLGQFGLQDAGLMANAAAQRAGIAQGNAGIQMQAANALNQGGMQDAQMRAAILGQLQGVGQGDAALRLQAAQISPAFEVMQQQRLGQLQQAGQMSEGYTQAGLDDARARWEWDANSQNRTLDDYLRRIQGQYGGSVSSAAKQQGSIGNTVGTAAGLGMMGYLGYLALTMSDRRLKTDAEKTGDYFKDMPVYRYRYKDDPSGTVHTGLMAQDVKKKMPEAVWKNSDGYMAVDYAKVLSS